MVHSIILYMHGYHLLISLAISFTFFISYIFCQSLSLSLAVLYFFNFPPKRHKHVTVKYIYREREREELSFFLSSHLILCCFYIYIRPNNKTQTIFLRGKSFSIENFCYCYSNRSTLTVCHKNVIVVYTPKRKYQILLLIVTIYMHLFPLTLCIYYPIGF